jgi:zinc protease
MTISTRPLPGAAREYHFPKFERTKSTNGISIITANVQKLPLVTIVAVIDATALADAPGKEGTAELVAKALREGTLHRDGATLALDLETLGTSVEAGADWDSTVVSLTVLRDHVSKAFEIMSEVLTSPAFRPEDIDRLKAERLSERIQLLDEPRGLADESFTQFVFAPGMRYAQPMSGTSKSVSSITREDIDAFYRSNYAPSAVTMIFAGDITAGEAQQLVESHLGSWKGKRHVTVVTADKAAREVRSTEIIAKADAAQSELRIGHVGVPRNHPDYFRIVVMNAVLGGLFSSRINLNLREANGYTYGASSYYDWRVQSGPFVISTAVQSEVTGAAIAETLKEIDRMRAEPIASDELTLATSYLEGVFPIRYETTEAIASALAKLVTFGLPENYYDTYRSNIAAVTPADVLEAAKVHVKPERLQICVVGNPALIEAQMQQLAIGPITVREPSDS